MDNIEINDNSKNGDCLLMYEVLVFHKMRVIKCLVDLKNNTFIDALKYYYKHYYKQFGRPFRIQYNKYTKEELHQLSLCA